MKTLNACLLVCTSALVGSPLVLADSGMLRISSDDRIAALSAARSDEQLVNVNRERVQYSWVLDRDGELQRSRYEASSRGFALTVTGEELTRGVAIVTDAPGAAMHISPAQNVAPLAKEALQLVSSDGTRHSGADAFQRVVDGATLRAYGIGFESSSLAVELAPVVGAGRLTLQSINALSGEDRYVVQVVDRNSTLSLRLSAARAVFLENGMLRARAGLVRAGAAVSVEVISSFLAGPDGQRTPVSFELSGDGVTLSHRLPAAGATIGGLWDLHLVTRAAGSGVMRDVKTSFAIARPTARFAGNFRSYDVPAAGIALLFGLEVSDAGRYEVRAVLLGTDASGELRPALMASSAAWFQPGTSSIELRFDAGKLAQTGLSAPYAMIDLQLLDQSRVVPLQSVPGRQPLDAAAD